MFGLAVVASLAYEPTVYPVDYGELLFKSLMLCGISIIPGTTNRHSSGYAVQEWP